MKNLVGALGVSIVTAVGVLAASPEKTPEPTAALPVPIILDSCRAEYAGGWLVKSISALRIKFTNEGDKTATVLRVAVTFNNNTLSVRDVGSFAPNITIDHRFRDLTGENMKFGLSHEDQPSTCKVQFIKFADGTMWAPGDQTESQADPSPSPSPDESPSPQASASAHPRV